jgi:hypothetical protein
MHAPHHHNLYVQRAQGCPYTDRWVWLSINLELKIGRRPEVLVFRYAAEVHNRFIFPLNFPLTKKKQSCRFLADQLHEEAFRSFSFFITIYNFCQR